MKEQVTERLLNVATDAEAVTQAYKLVLIEDETTDIDLPDGTTTPSLNKRIKQFGGQVTSVNGEKGEIIIDGNSLGLGSASKYNVTDLMKTENLKDPTGKNQQEINKSIFPVFSVKSFGAKGDGVTDDRAAIQATIDACIKAGGGTVYFPSTGDKYYSVKSKHPIYKDSALVAELAGSMYVRGGITFLGEQYFSRIQYDGVETAVHLLNISARTNYMTYEKFYLEANKKCGYALFSADDFHPMMTATLCTFRGATIYGAKIATYVATFNSCVFSNSANGCFFGGTAIQPTAPSTSIAMNGCYANGNTGAGYEFGFTTYVAMNACASDSNDIGYKFASAYGLVMNGCGSEKTRKPIYIQAYRGVSINTFYMLSCGSISAATPSEYLIEFVAGTNATLSGIYGVSSSGRHFNYVLGLTGSTYGSENITVTDRSVVRSSCYFVPNYAFSRPIKLLRDDESNNDTVFNVSNVEELKSAIARVGKYYECNHNVTIKLADGDYDLDDESFYYIQNVSGSGELCIESASGVNTSVKLNGFYRRLRVMNCTAKIRFKNLSLSETRANGNYDRLWIVASNNVVLDNVVVARNNVNAGYGVRLMNGSKCFLINGTHAPAAFISKTWDWDAGSEFILEDSTTAPSGVWNNSMRVYNSAPTTSLGWVWVNGWKTFGAIT